MIHYSDEPTQSSPSTEIKNPSIFLAGPTKRSSYKPGETLKERIKTQWRQDFIDMFGDRFDLFAPEPFHNKWPNYEAQIKWELEYLEKADYIVFWIPRNSEFPGFTTNVEFGEWYKHEKTFYGRPGWAEKCQYLDYIWKVSQPTKDICTELSQFNNFLK